MERVVIGISGNHLTDGSGPFAMYPRSYVNYDYIRSIVEAGGIPIILPFNESEEVIEALVDMIDGLILSGGHDVAPHYYGEEPLQGLGEIWPERDQFDFNLIKYAKAKEIPIMGICRGHQILNVYHGGTLYQDLSYAPKCNIKHAQNQRPDLATHRIFIEEDSRFKEIIGKNEMRVNSFHHQIIKDLGNGLKITARAKDGTIEAIEGTDYPYLIGYQFHPEMMSATSKDAACLFHDFIQAVKGL